MTHEELQAIKARAHDAMHTTPDEIDRISAAIVCEQDVPTLVAEVERLRALCATAYERVRFLDDVGVGGEGWQSDELQTLVAALGTIARNEDDVK